jgi:uncharacterized damage-inducible protein DinB
MNRKALIESLRLDTVILRDFIEAIPADRIEERRNDDFWTIREHVSHLALTQIMLCKRIEVLMKEEHAVIVPYVPDEKPHEDEPAKKPIGELLDTFGKWRERQIRLLESCGDAVWARSADHPEYRSYSFEILVRHVLLHDSYHMNRIEELWLLKDERLKKW